MTELDIAQVVVGEILPHVNNASGSGSTIAGVGIALQSALLVWLNRALAEIRERLIKLETLVNHTIDKV